MAVQLPDNLELATKIHRRRREGHIVEDLPQEMRRENIEGPRTEWRHLYQAGAAFGKSRHQASLHVSSTN